MSDVIETFLAMPAHLLTRWGVWLIAGLLLGLWHMRARTHRRERARQRLAAAMLPRARSSVRQHSGVRPALASGIRAAKPAATDAFGELEALLEPSSGSGVSRRPGD